MFQILKNTDKCKWGSWWNQERKLWKPLLFSSKTVITLYSSLDAESQDMQISTSCYMKVKRGRLLREIFKLQVFEI
jgi:hypothetical protein